jgi:hypothetical protein
MFVLSGAATEGEVKAAIHVYKRGHEDGVRHGRLRLQGELRHLLDVPAA